MATIKTYDYKKILQDVKNWKIVEEEKAALKLYAEERLSKMREKEISNPVGSLEEELRNLHSILEYCCSKTSVMELTTEVENFKKGLTTGKIKTKVRKKDKKTGKYIFVNGEPHKDFRKLRIFSSYLNFRLKLPNKYVFLEEKDIPSSEKLKQRKLIHFTAILKIPKSKNGKQRKKQEKQKNKLTEKKLELIQQNLNTDWKRDYFYLARGKGPRFGEIMQIELEDFDIGGPLAKVTLKPEHSKTYGGEDLPIFNKEASDYLKKRIAERRASGELGNSKFIQNSGSGIKSWGRRLGNKLFKATIRTKDYRDAAAQYVVDKKIINDRYRLCRWMSWELNSPMADTYLDKKEIDLEKSGSEHLEQEKIDLNSKISNMEEKHAIDMEKRDNDVENLKQQVATILNLTTLKEAMSEIHGVPFEDIPIQKK